MVFRALLAIILAADRALGLGLAGGSTAGMRRFVRYRSAAGRLALMPMIASIRDPGRGVPIVIGDLTIRLIAYCAYRLGLAGGRAAGMGRFIRYRSAAGRLALVPMLASIRDPARSFPIVVCQFTVFLTADRALGLGLAGGSTAGMRRFDSIELALIQYNAGEGRAKRWKPDSYKEKVLPRIKLRSTRRYVEQITSRYRNYIK